MSKRFEHPKPIVSEWQSKDKYEMEVLVLNELSLNSSNNPFAQILCYLDGSETVFGK